MHPPLGPQAAVGLPGQTTSSLGMYPATVGGQMLAPGAQESFRHAQRRPKLGSLTISCPTLVGAMGPGLGFVYMPITRLQVEAQCHISMGFVKTTLDCYFPQTWHAAPLQLCVPKQASTVISEVVIENLVRDQVYSTAIVPADDATKGGYKPSVAYDASGTPATDPSASNDPELFVLPMPTPCMPGDRLKVVINTFEPLAFEEGSYVLRLPLEVPYSMIPEGYTLAQLLDVIITINTGSPTTVKYSVPSGHGVTPGVTAPGTVTLSLTPGPEIRNTDVEVGYHVWGNDMFLALHVSPPRAPHPADPDPRGAFVLSVAPPAPAHTTPFPRAVVFLLDRSGSMTGDPVEYAKAALTFGLRSLTPLDTFTVAAFDHEQLWFTPNGQLLPATAENVAACETWIRSSIHARGLTDINSPLKAALAALATRPMMPGARSLPFIFLVTDGCVQDEKDICRSVEQHMASALHHHQQLLAQQPSEGTGPQLPPPPGVPRIVTFGIGPYCNHYFLKQLATYGRGNFDAAFRPHAIQAQMQRLLTAAQRPVLSDVTLTLPGVKSAELYPFPLPDLFCGLPLMVAGKYDGTWPSEGITLNGMLPNGTAWSSNPVLPAKDSGLPLDKIFIKNRIDLLTAQAWLAGNPPAMVNQIVELSIATGVPCVHTRTVGFATTAADYQQLQAARDTHGKRRVNLSNYAIGGAAGLVVLAGLGVGAALAFGDVGATAANAVFGGGDLLGGLGDMGGGDGGNCCDAGDCDCNGSDGCDAGACDLGGCVIA